ncbi:MAG TPA: hypothetical protein PLL53_14260 [Saprospiraceae bacterium]|nr:hypothetical protein [Saprospiraceae bacterium]
MKQMIVYQLVEDDVQRVAEEELGRVLKKQEIISLIDNIAENISWYDGIATAIRETIGNNEDDE